MLWLLLLICCCGFVVVLLWFCCGLIIVIVVIVVVLLVSLVLLSAATISDYIHPKLVNSPALPMDVIPNRKRFVSTYLLNLVELVKTFPSIYCKDGCVWMNHATKAVTQKFK